MSKSGKQRRAEIKLKRLERARRLQDTLNRTAHGRHLPADGIEPADRDLLARHNLTADEYERIVSALGREPNLTELGLFSVMWSEHCSYKSSKKWLKTLPTTAPWVICGPGENAGVIDIGEGLAAIG